MKALFIVTNSDKAVWLSELTHPYWHLAERGVEIDFASPKGGPVVWDKFSDPRTEGSMEPNDLVSRGFLANTALTDRLETTLALKDADLDRYDAVHVAGGRGAVFDLYPNEDVGKALEHFWAHGKVVGAICHGAIALGNVPGRMRGRGATGYTLKEDQDLQHAHGIDYVPQYPQRVLEATGARYVGREPHAVCVVVDGQLVTGQNQESASEYGVALLHTILGHSPVLLGELEPEVRPIAAE